MRTYVYVIAPPGTDAWQLRTTLQTTAQAFESRTQALAAARQLCRWQWEERSRPCGVRVQNDAGEWVDDVLFGDDGDAVE
jgi:hypothetical protein